VGLLEQVLELELLMEQVLALALACD